MDTSPSYTDPALGPSHSTDSSVEDQDGYLTTGDLGCPPDPWDPNYRAPHMLILEKISSLTPYQLSQVENGPLALDGGSRWDNGNEAQQAAVYRQSVNSSQLFFSQNNLACPSPTSLPSYHTPPDCDHRNCNPPPDVEFLSRRFEENINWIRVRKLAVDSFARGKRGSYLFPVEILEMILSNLPVIDPSIELERNPRFLRIWNRHDAFRTFAATCVYLRKIFCIHSWTTRVVTAGELPVIAGLLKEVRVKVGAHSIEVLIVQLQEGCLELLRDCMTALPRLHTLAIMDDDKTKTREVGAAFGSNCEFSKIKKAAIPLCAHPLMKRLPRVEDLTCYFDHLKLAEPKSILASLHGPSRAEIRRGVEPTLKNLTIVGPNIPPIFAEDLVEKFPRIRKVCLPEPVEEVMEILRGLKEIVEFEILFDPNREHRRDYHIGSIKPIAIEILRASECHKDCKCGYKCGCTQTGSCRECNPPKRFLRIKAYPLSHLSASCKETGDREAGLQEIRTDDKGACLEEIQVGP